MYKNRIGRPQVTFCFIIVLILSLNTFADIRLPSVISDNMVLQQGMEVPIWGWADPCEQITIKYGIYGTSWSATADAEGNWKTKIGPFKPSGNAGMDLSLEGKNTIVLKNVAVGEVWVCSGQSNMEFMLSQAENSKVEIAGANYPSIRLFTVGRKVAYEPMKNCRGQWKICDPRSAGGFSAIGYFFGVELIKQLDVPIGLIHTSWGGTPAESWMSRECIDADADFKPILQRFEQTSANYPELFKKYLSAKKQYEKEEAEAKAKNQQMLMPRPEEPIGPNHPYSPTGLFNSMILPVVPYAIRGAIWYQGESNAWRAYQYRKLFPAMIKCWRQAWDEDNFPFLYVQLANWRAVATEPKESDWAELREAQTMTLSEPNTGMAVAIDLGDPNDPHNIHPPNKKDVGKRLALWALAKTYGKDIEYSGPVYRLMEVDGNSAVLHFEHVAGGLVAKGGEPLKGFAIAGPDRKFVWAEAKIRGDKVIVSSEKVTEPVAVRYAWADNPICNLYNKADLPAVPFRTDDWPGITVGRK